MIFDHCNYLGELELKKKDPYGCRTISKANEKKKTN